METRKGAVEKVTDGVVSKRLVLRLFPIQASMRRTCLHRAECVHMKKVRPTWDSRYINMFFDQLD